MPRKKLPERSKPVMVYIPPEIYRKLQELQIKRAKPMSRLIKEIIIEYLKEIKMLDKNFQK